MKSNDNISNKFTSSDSLKPDNSKKADNLYLKSHDSVSNKLTFNDAF